VDALARPVRLGALEVRNRAFVAPLAAVSDVPFRRMCREQGASLAYVEMLSAEAIVRRNPRTLAMLARDASEDVLGVQVTGPNPEVIGEAVRFLDGEGFDTIDLNMGCPVRKIVAAGWGSAYLRDPERLSRAVGAAREATSRPLSAKIRTGEVRSKINVSETAARVAAAGADFLTIHGRTRTDDYSIAVDVGAIRDGGVCARAASRRAMVVIGNGDVFDRAGAGRMIEAGCDAVMISRGALGNPWVFRELLGDSSPVTVAEWLDGALRHLDRHEAFYRGHPLACFLARKHLRWYARGFPGSRTLRDRLSLVEDFPAARTMLREFAAGLAADRARDRIHDVAADPKTDMERDADRAAAGG
jgi:nifR3 family TIM-barrel protein